MIRKLGLLAFASTAAMFSLVGPSIRVASADDENDENVPAKRTNPEQSLAIIKAVSPSLVRVEYTLQFDKGEAPHGAGWSGAMGYGYSSIAEVVGEERPLEMPGFLIAGDKVIAPDPIIHARFVKSIAVRFGDGEPVAAKISAYGKTQPVTILTLDKPLAGGAKPATFDKAKKGPYSAVRHGPRSGQWTTQVSPAGGSITVTSGGRTYQSAPGFALIVDSTGAAVGMTGADEIPHGDGWKGSPADWPLFSADEYAKLMKAASDAADKGLVRVTLNFRSPRQQPENMRMSFRGGGGDDENATVRHVTGVLVDDKTVLVLSELKANITARLQSVKVRQSTGDAVDGKFDRTLTDFGGLVVKLDKPLQGAVKPADAKDLPSLRNVLLPTAELVLHGEQRTVVQEHERMRDVQTGWRRKLYPTFTGNQSYGGYNQQQAQAFVFNDAGELLSLPIGRREKAVSNDRYSFRSNNSNDTPAAYVWPAISGDVATFADASNVPLSEEEESRLAWLGVELQPLTPELARANEVSNQTKDGQTGALVTYVYPDSPAAKAGIEVGNVLLRLHVADQPQPIDIVADPSAFGEQAYPWDRFDELPEQFFDRVPRPWPGVESTLARTLTDLGFGKNFDLEVAQDGKVKKLSLAVAQGPGHFDSAPKYKYEALGVTVKEPTYEVRRYFQLPQDQPGLIIGKIEMGSRASTSGLKPYELITHVNDQPVKTVKEFEERVKDQKELRLSIKRMTKGRQVNVNVAGPAPATKPATPDRD